MEKTDQLFQTLDSLSKKLGVKPRDVLSRKRTRLLVDARCQIAATLRARQEVRQPDIADLFGISQAAVSKLLVRHRDLMQTDRHYQALFSAL